MLGVAGDLPQFSAKEIRRLHQIIPSLQMQVLRIILKDLAHQSTLGMIEHQPCTRFFMINMEKIQV